MKRVGKLAFRSIVYFEIVTTLALVVGLLAVNIVKPGVGVNLASATAEAGAEFAKKQTTLSGVIEHTVPQSFFEAAAANEVLQIVFFAIIFAVALSQVQGPAKTFMLTACESRSNSNYGVYISGGSPTLTDLIAAGNTGKAVSAPEQLRAIIAAHKPGDRITVQVRRNGSTKTLKATLGSRS